MRLIPKHGSAFVCRETTHTHSGAACCSRRQFFRGLSALGASVALGSSTGRAQTSEKPFRIDTHHHISSPGFIAEIRARNTGQVPLMNWTVAKSLDDMDKGGVATSILSISEPSVHFGDAVAARAL